MPAALCAAPWWPAGTNATSAPAYLLSCRSIKELRKDYRVSTRVTGCARESYYAWTVGKALVYGQVADQHHAHHVWPRARRHRLRAVVPVARQVKVEQRLGTTLPPQHLDARLGVPVLAPGAPGAHFGFDPVDGTNEATHVHTLNPGCPTIPPPTNEVLIPFDRLDRMVVFL